MAISDVSIPQDGGHGNVKLHPYLITLVRWCVSCLWSTASVFLHRLVTTPLPSITAAKHPPKPAARGRQAGTDHLHPEPRVECVVLHTPETHTLDVIFVHGLYGSLGNTWRQGEWRTKYKLDPTKVALRNHSTKQCNCTQNKQDQMVYNNFQQLYAYETNLNETNLNENVAFNQFNGCFRKILPKENALITEKFYNNTLINVNVDNYDTQAKFVTQLFKNDCDKNCDLKKTFNCNFGQNKCNYENSVTETKCSSENCKCNLNEKCKINECKCKLNDAKCEIGCGCICDDCYSSCWPKDWIKEDFPGARVISINYTSDPYLWRPLWVKQNKRLRLHERADQMMEQLLQLGVGQRPIIWVGHSKGGLFIKQIYCEAYEAYLKINKNKIVKNNNCKDQSDVQYKKDTEDCKLINKYSKYTIQSDDTIKNIQNNNEARSNHYMNESYNNIGSNIGNETTLRSIDDMSRLRDNHNSGNNNLNWNQHDHIGGENRNNKDTDNNCNEVAAEMFASTETDALIKKQVKYDEDKDYIDIRIRHDEQIGSVQDNVTAEVNTEVNFEVMSSANEEDIQELETRASLWCKSSGFMFYSVPHRGSPLADIKTPITTRSVELLEIAKDCPLVLRLQERWVRAARAAPASRVRSLVETGRTLMSVLWLRIVSVDSADAGVGSLHGVSVDHREICKPASRNCLLYTELTDLIRGALAKCDCQ